METSIQKKQNGQSALTYKPPTVAELFKDNIEEAFRHDELNTLLNAEPNMKWVKEHPFIKNYKYIPIDKIEFMLRKIFKRYRIEITNQGTAFNGVWVTVRVHYLNPVINDFDWHDGIGACQLQTSKGTSPADLANINNGALSMAFPIAKTVAVKDACDHFGKLFGSDLNRKDTIPFQNNNQLLDADIVKELASAKDMESLNAVFESHKDHHNNYLFNAQYISRKKKLSLNEHK